MLTAFYHRGFAAPLGAHPMPMRKFALVAEGVRPGEDVRLAEPSPVTEADLLRVHTPTYVAAIQTGEPRVLAQSQRFPWTRKLYPSVCLTSGGCLAAAREALQHGASAAIVSGFHHACADHGEGFCTFNGLVIALEAMRAAGEIHNGAVLDMDLHYGNGTAQLAATRPWLTALSIYGSDFCAGVPYRDVTVRRHLDGDNHRSYSLPAGCTRETMLEIMTPALSYLAAVRPQIILYQAGADPYYEDPYSPLALDHDDLLARDRRVFEFARDLRIPIAWVLAGGYTRDVTKVVRVHLNTFAAWRSVFG